MFRDDSAIRTIGREGVVLLGGGRALLMQLAHPQVAAGVAEHSNFQSDGIARLLRTLESTYTIVFGAREEARRTAARVRAMHERVRGRGYRANDPALLLWVHATLVDTALRTHSLFLRPLSWQERERYYDDSKVMAELFGIPASALPADFAAFRCYTEGMVAALRVSDTARELAGLLFRPSPYVGPLPLVVRELTAGLLPRSLREQYGLPWDGRRAAALRVGATLSRAVLSHLPPPVRSVPSLVMPGQM